MRSSPGTPSVVFRRWSSLPAALNVATFFVDRHLAEGRAARPASGLGVARHLRGGRRPGRRAPPGRSPRLGVEIEQRVLLALDDSPAFAAAFWGAAKLGAVAVPVNTLMGEAEYAFLLNDSRARVAVVEAAVAPRAAAVRGLGARGCARWWSRAARAAGRARLRRGARPRPSPREAAPTTAEDIVYWGYTSGSTGRPRRPCTRTRDFVAAADLVGVGVFGLGADDLVFSASKMYFAFGLGNSLYFPARVGRRLACWCPSGSTPSARSRSSRPSDRRCSSRCRRSTRACSRCPTPSGAWISRRSASASPPARRCRPPIFDAWAGALRPRAGGGGGLHRGAARLHRQPAGRGAPRGGRRAGARLRGAARRRRGAAVPAGTVGHLLVKGADHGAVLLEPARADAHDDARRVAAHRATCSRRTPRAGSTSRDAPTTC